MSDRYILAGVGRIELLNGTTGQHYLTAKTLTQSGISVDLSAEDIRGGSSGKLLGKYFHSSNFNLTLTDALFDLNYIALNVGGTITVGGDGITSETVTIAQNDKITVQGTPVAWNGMDSIVGWYSKPAEDDWKLMTFEGKTATVSGVTVGETYCVRYSATNDAQRNLVVPASIIPSECYAILTMDLFSAGLGDNLGASSKVGTVTVDIPRYLLSGSQEFSLDMTGASTSQLSGSALETFSAEGVTCADASGFYAIWKEVIAGKTMEDGLAEIAVSGGDVEIQKNASMAMKVIGIYDDNTTGVLNNDRITFTVTPSSAGTIANGILTAGSSATTGTITVTPTHKPELETTIKLTVEA